MSKLLIPCPRTSESVRLLLPNVNAGGWLNADVSNQRSRRLCASPESLALRASWFGREPPPNELVILDEVDRNKGVPDWKVVIPLTCHPDAILLPTVPRLFSKGLPVPNGRSRM